MVALQRLTPGRHVLRSDSTTGPVPRVEGLKALDTDFAWRRTPEDEAAVK